MMDPNKLKGRLEALYCHIHGDAANITVMDNDTVELETCCLLFRHQLLLMAGENKNMVSDPSANG